MRAALEFARPPVTTVPHTRLKETARTVVRPRVVALVPRGEVIRNFVYTNTFDEVAAAAEMSLLAVLPNHEMAELLQQRYGTVRPLTEYRERWPVRFQREVLDLAHGRWLQSEAARERWRLRDAEARTWQQKLFRTGKKLACYPFANRTGLRVLSRLERTASRWLSTTQDYLQLFRQLQPTLVFNGSHVHSRIAIQAVQAAQWLGIPTATFVFSWDNLTSQGRIMLPYDYYFVWNSALRQQLLEMYDQVRPEQVIVTGTPQFDFHFQEHFYWSREEFCARVGADPARPIVLYTTGMANHMPGEPDIVEGIADMLQELQHLGRPQLLVRVYPKDLTGRFDELKRRRPEILFPAVPWEAAWLTPKFEDAYLLTNTLRHCAVGLNVASTVSLELCMFGKAVINVGYNPPGVSRDTVDYKGYYIFDHYRPLVESGAVQVAHSQNSMRYLLRQALTAPQACLKQQEKLLQQMFGDTLDGNSGQRVAQELIRLASCGQKKPLWKK